MAWRLAGSLIVLRNEVNALAPHRSKVSDGTIGDQAHADRPSRHNPNRFGVVTALDITHDPAHGCDIHAIAERLRRRPHPELAYMISNDRIAGRSTGWAWRDYDGSNPHTRHVHFGVGTGSDGDPRPPYDSPAPWGVLVPAHAPATPSVPQEDDDMAYILRAPGKPARLITGSLCPQLSAGGVDAWRKAGAKTVDVPEVDYDRHVDQVSRLIDEP